MDSFQRRKGAVNMSGPYFEVKMLAFFFLQGLSTCQNFRIATNMDSCGALDDVIFQYKENGVWKTSFIQLKHKENIEQALKSFWASRSTSDLIKYLQSCHVIMQQFSADNNEHPVFGGNFENCTFMLYTNGVFKTKRNKNHGHFLKDDIHNSGGNNGFAFSFSKDNGEDKFIFSLLKKFEECKELLDGIHHRNGENDVLDAGLLQEIRDLWASSERDELKDLLEKLVKKPTKQTLENVVRKLDYVSYFDTFLNKFQILDGQANANALDDVIKRQICKICATDCHETNTIYEELIKHIKTWWESGNTFITEEAEFWRNMMQSRVDRVTQLSADKIQQLDDLNVSFRDLDSELIPLCDSLVNVVADRGSTLLSCAKLRQILNASENTKYMFIDLEVMNYKKQEVLSLWPSRWCDILVVDCGKSDKGVEVLRDMDLDHKYKLVLVTTNAISGVKCVFDSCGYVKLDDTAQSVLLERNIMFQNYKVKLEHVTQNNVEVLKFVTADFVLQLLQGSQLPEIGNVLDSLSGHYIERKVYPYLLPSSIWSLQGRIILLSADPGAGKSTFLKRIALQSKNTKPSFLVIRINLSRNSGLLRKLAQTDCSLERVLEFVWLAAGNHREPNFEKSVFRHAILTSGKCVILFDAFDEINPTYTEVVLQMIRTIAQTEVEKLCVAFRPIVKDMLKEYFLGATLITLIPLSRPEKIDLLRALWKDCKSQNHLDKIMSMLSQEELQSIRNNGYDERFDGHVDQKLERFTRNIIQTVSNKLDESFSTTPLHLVLLAVVFESYLVVSIKDGQLYEPVEVDIIKLYDKFVEVKLNIYCSEKKGEDENSPPAVTDDNEILRKWFMDNHKMAGVVAFLPPNLLAGLQDKELESETDTFLKRIQDGKEKRGVVLRVIGGRPYFLHRTFEEYFAAMWFSENYHKNRDVLQLVYFFETNRVFREMFDRILSRNCPLIQQIMNKSIGGILPIVSTNINEMDAGGRSVLHIAAIYETYSFACVSPLPQCTLVDILAYNDTSVNQEDRVFKLTPIEYAYFIGNNVVLNELLRISDIDQNETVLVIYENSDRVNDSIFSNPGEISLLRAVEFGNYDLASLLIKLGKDTDFMAKYGNDPLRMAVENSYFPMVKMLMEESRTNMNVCDCNDVSVIKLAKEKSPHAYKTKLPTMPLYYASVKKCIMYYSDNNRIELPFRNWQLLQSYYSPSFSCLKFRRGAAYSYHSMYRYLFVENFKRMSAKFISDALSSSSTTPTTSYSYCCNHHL
ncbi:uncharacterized protein [Periplaneta americana]|uniref:uncharacterized protein n=1 Tax=Periplaneta americana TaxID=6978 RepID=UPI0037E71262